jgi:hypothetical protein
MALFNGRVVIAFKSSSSDELLVASSVDGMNWPALTRGTCLNTGQTTSAEPAMVVFDNKLWIAFKQDQVSNSIYVISSADGIVWSPPTDIYNQTATSPAITVFKQLPLHRFHNK